MPITRDQVLAALKTVQDPELFKDLVTLNMVKDVQIQGDHVTVTVELTTPACPKKEQLESDVRRAVLNAGAHAVVVNLTAQTRGPGGRRRPRRAACCRR